MTVPRPLAVIIISQMRAFRFRVCSAVQFGGGALAAAQQAAAPPNRRTPAWYSSCSGDTSRRQENGRGDRRHEESDCVVAGLGGNSGRTRRDCMPGRTGAEEASRRPRRRSSAMQPTARRTEFWTVYAALGEQRQPLPSGRRPRPIPGQGDRGTGKEPPEIGFDLNLELMLGRLYLQASDYARRSSACGVVVDAARIPRSGMLLAAAEEGAGQQADANRTLETTLEDNPEFFRGRPAG